MNLSFALSVPDDAYYYFKIAQNVSLGHGITFDGLAPTNGFHPLWMTLIAPIWWAAEQHDSELPVHLALTLGALLDLCTIIGIWGLARMLIPRRLVCSLVVLAYAWNPYNAAASVNGLETSVGSALFVWSLLTWAHMRLAPEPHQADWLVLGVLWSTLLMARTDYLVIIAPCALDLAWRFRYFWKRAWPVTIGAVVLLPWLAWNLLTFGSVTQVSGNAYPYYLHALWQAQSHTLTEWLTHEVRLGYGILANLARLSGFGKGIVPLAFAIAWLVSAAALDRRRSDDWTQRRWLLLSGLLWPTVGSVSLLFFHGLVRWMYIPWYFVPTSILLTLWFGALLNRLASQHISWAVILAGVYLGFQIQHAVSLWSQGGMWASARQAIERQTPRYLALCERYDTLGITDSGYAGYYLPCRVVNLDGVVNNDAFAAIVRGEFKQYLDRSGIDYVALNDIVRNLVEMREGPIPETAPFAPR
ncbi:MAG: hypothetical protein JXA74_13755 [Anaerolineae bacterium]|nr:hypothetical protein [Anaerolineae bacterium]